MSTIETLIQQQAGKHRVLFWYDEEGTQREAFDAAYLIDVEKRVIENNEFTLKREILREAPQKRFLLYAPYKRPADEENWLLDLLLANGEFHNDELGIWLGDTGLEERFLPFLKAHAAFFKDSNRRDLLKRRLADCAPGELSEEALFRKCCAVAAGSTEESRDALVLLFLNDCRLSEAKTTRDLQKCGLDGDFLALLHSVYKYSGESPDAKDFALSLFRDEIRRLTGEPPKLSMEARVLMNRWQNDQSRVKPFRAISAWTAQTLNLAEDFRKMPPETLAKLGLFREARELFLEKVLEDLQAGKLPGEEVLKALQEEEPGGPWGGEFREAQTAAREALCLRQELDRFVPRIYSYKNGFEQYSAGWYRVDGAYRRFETASKRSGEDLREALDALGEVLRRSYENSYLHPLCDSWQTALDQDDGRHCEKFRRQWEFYTQLPTDRKTAVIISDALRFEAGAELGERVRKLEKYSASLQAMRGVIPSYTQLGMAALLPHHTLSLNPADGVVFADGKSTAGTDNRRALLRAARADADALQADEFLNLSDKDRRQRLNGVKLLYLYHNEIDHIGDNMQTEMKTFDTVDSALDTLTKLIKACGNLSFSRIYVTADHGFLFQCSQPGDSLFPVDDPPADRMEKASGIRYVLGHGLEGEPTLMKVKPQGYECSAEVYAVRGELRLRKKGTGKRYVHGGSSLQETVIPLLSIEHKDEYANQKVGVSLANNAERRVITGGVKSVTFFQKEAVTPFDPTRPDTPERLPLTVSAAFYDAQSGERVSESHELCFNLTEPEDRLRLLKQDFAFKGAAGKNGQQVVLRLTEKLSATNERTVLEENYTMRMMVERDF